MAQVKRHAVAGETIIVVMVAEDAFYHTLEPVVLGDVLQVTDVLHNGNALTTKGYIFPQEYEVITKE